MDALIYLYRKLHSILVRVLLRFWFQMLWYFVIHLDLLLSAITWYLAYNAHVIGLPSSGCLKNHVAEYFWHIVPLNEMGSGCD